jgi:AAA15 family ATPase/GTPase
MVDSFTIRNFRSISEASVPDCRLINVLVGDNGSGKTALLEALFLAAGVSPELALRARSWRGYEGGSFTGSPEDMHRALWSDLFFNFETQKAVVVSMKGTGEQHRSVTFRLNKRGQRTIVAPDRKKQRVQPKIEPAPLAEFKWQIQGHPDVKMVPTFEDGKLIFPPSAESVVQASFFAANRTVSSTEIANRFSKLSRTYAEMQFVENYRAMYPQICGLSVEVGAGVPMLYAAIDRIAEKIPLGLASGGMNKLAGILLAMQEHAGGIVLIDEIENGFYYERLPQVWRAILHFAREYKTQVFASTHSSECLYAAAKLAEESPAEFSMIRTVIPEYRTVVRCFDGAKFAGAVLSNVEVR